MAGKRDSRRQSEKVITCNTFYHFAIGSREGAESPSESNNLTNVLGLATGLSQQLVFLNWRQDLLGAKHTRIGPAGLSRQTRRLTQ